MVGRLSAEYLLTSCTEIGHFIFDRRECTHQSIFEITGLAVVIQCKFKPSVCNAAGVHIGIAAARSRRKWEWYLQQDVSVLAHKVIRCQIEAVVKKSPIHTNI